MKLYHIIIFSGVSMNVVPPYSQDIGQVENCIWMISRVFQKKISFWSNTPECMKNR